MSSRSTVTRFTRRASLLLLALAACAPGDAERTARPAARVTSAAHDTTARLDDFGDPVSLAPAARIVSLSPMTTELLFSIGAGERVVGRTDYDAWPAVAKRVPSVGAGIRPNVERILA
ncbi:MAG: hypothetical protein HOQ09_01470, partial [Gemmatimonadaceae bacterium]|nr:hypothetical protein [Gemmatimonadaceae bacterium]